jgi:sarcosine oxidase
MPHYDAIVLGAGGVGSAALYELARRGLRAIGIDRFAPPHDRGSSHGQTRVIRQAYFEHPDYVPLLLESYRMWRELEQATGLSLLHEIGLVQLGPPDGAVVSGVLTSARLHGLPVESMSASDVEKRWPGLRASDEFVAVFEPRGGYLLVEDCVRAHLAAAKAAGAELLANAEVIDWSANDREVSVVTTNGEFTAATLVVTAGAWSTKMLAGLSLPLTVRRKSLIWFDAPSGDYDVNSGMPIYLFETLGGVFYGFPKLDLRGVKVGEHSGGVSLDDPLAVDRNVLPTEQQSLERFLRRHLPGVPTRITDHTVCLYTMSPDEHFLVDHHPRHPNVAFAAGLSGHGFKFAPVLGQALADLVLDRLSALPIDFLSLDRLNKYRPD